MAIKLASSTVCWLIIDDLKSPSHICAHTGLYNNLEDMMSEYLGNVVHISMLLCAQLTGLYKKLEDVMYKNMLQPRKCFTHFYVMLAFIIVSYFFLSLQFFCFRSSSSMHTSNFLFSLLTSPSCNLGLSLQWTPFHLNLGLSLELIWKRHM